MNREPFRGESRGPAKEEGGASGRFAGLLYEKPGPLVSEAGMDRVIQRERASKERRRDRSLAQDGRRGCPCRVRMSGKEEEEEKRGEPSHERTNPAPGGLLQAFFVLVPHSSILTSA